MHVSGLTPTAGKHPFLLQLGERVRALRARRGMTRKELSIVTGVSERHLGSLEAGAGNASILVLLEVAQALKCSLAELLGEAIATRQSKAAARPPRIALIGLRGAGKSTLGRMLAQDLGFPFVELSREIEKFAGCTVSEIQSLYGQNAYRRYERRAVEEIIQINPEAVIATPGGLVSDPASFNLLLSHCTTVWLKASPQDHMGRVVAQGDLRPMAGSIEAMEDLQSILAGREPFYSKAELHLDTSAEPLDRTFIALRGLVERAISQGKH